MKVTDEQAQMLIQMVYFARGLVWTIMFHPIEYKLANKFEITPIGQSNLQLLGTIMIFIYRRLLIPRSTRVIPVCLLLKKF